MRLISTHKTDNYSYINMPYESTVLILREEYIWNNEAGEGWAIHGIMNGEYSELAAYKTKERAEQVLKELHSHYITGGPSFVFPDK